MQSGLYNEKDELIYNWKDLIDAGYVTFVNGNLEEMYYFYEYDYPYKLKLDDNITYIDINCFDYNDTLKEIILGENIKVINYEAFDKCRNLEKVILNKNLKEIREDIFFGCNNLKTIIYPGTKSEFEQIKGWKHIFDGNKLTINNIQFQTSLEKLIEEGKTLMEANRLMKKTQIER